MVTFQEEREEQTKQEQELDMGKIKNKGQEMVIKFLSEEDDDNSISGLSQSIGKLWDAESMIDMWETNTQEVEDKSLEFSLRTSIN